uniref:Uncharacterized protein n=1 Tax=Setaria italica TaxID=4555 RepID=K3Y457_SETIT
MYVTTSHLQYKDQVSVPPAVLEPKKLKDYLKPSTA